MLTEEEVRYVIYAFTGYFTPRFFSQALLAVLLFLAFYALLYLLIALVTAAAVRLGKLFRTDLLDLLLYETQRPLTFLAVAVSAYFAADMVFPSSSFAGRSLFDLFAIALVILSGIIIANVVDAFMVWYGRRLAESPENGRSAEELFPMLRKIAIIAIYVGVLALVLSLLGVEVAPLIAGLGIAGLAVALALQDTLSNFFAGLYLLADKPVRVGDFVRLSDGTEGIVREIGWRSTKITVPDGNDLILPNSLLAQEKILNYDTPERAMRVTVQVDVAYDSDLDKAEAALKRAAEKVISETSGGVKKQKPVIRLAQLGEFSLKYAVCFYAEDFKYQWPLKHAMHKEILRELRKEGIEIPFPTRVVSFKRGEVH
ncbi:MAG: mechanosensitive ion channel family protein [Candidatus ainarchaeum sp.]|nr:mechanosensitive ion channel family protein [Candidatus ainarchaeum sp.]